MSSRVVPCDSMRRQYLVFRCRIRISHHLPRIRQGSGDGGERVFEHREHFAVDAARVFLRLQHQRTAEGVAGQLGS
jgi:hypothetical protein